jgi:transketolase
MRVSELMIKTTKNTGPEALSALAKEIRKDVLDLIYRSKSPHIGSCYSMVEILVALYWRCLRIGPSLMESRARDRFLLSKGHGCPALYAVLSRKGIMPREALEGYAVNGGTLEQHPTRNVPWGIEVASGSLGHGLSIGAGMAFAGKHDQGRHRVFVLLSDGETNEGTVWEAALWSAAQRLDNLVAIVDYNKMQALGPTKDVMDLDPFADKWRSFGWAVEEADGHDLGGLVAAFGRVPFEAGRPSAVIAHTIKGKGVRFMENSVLWHYRCPDEWEYRAALAEIG